MRCGARGKVVEVEAVGNLLGWVLLTAGGLFVFIGGVGLLRMPDLFSRMHAAGLTDTLGSILVLAGLVLQSGLTLASVKLVAILAFLLLTGPAASYALANAALLSGAGPVCPEREPGPGVDSG